MEVLLNIHLEKLPEGVYLATSDDLPDLLAQGDTPEETLEIAQDVAAKLIESYLEWGDELPDALKIISGSGEISIAVRTV